MGGGWKTGEGHSFLSPWEGYEKNDGKEGGSQEMRPP